MKFEVDGKPAYASTGGRKPAEDRPWIVLLHGAGASHLAWMLQSRSLAYDGYNILAPDLPGHNLSGGEALGSVGEYADWVLAAMSAAGCEKAVLIGHSMGGLIAIEAANRAPDRVGGIVFIATAAAIPVNPKLIETAENDEESAFRAMMAWAHGPEAHMHDNTWPGGSHLFFGIDVMRLNRPGALAADLKACAGYAEGLERAGKIGCATLCILAEKDRMTPAKSGRRLAEVLPDNETVISPDSGHSIPTERPGFVNEAIRRFLATRVPETRESAKAGS